jgi:Putative addiction module component
MTVDELMREALALDAKDRASMAHELLNSLESLSEAEVEQLWIEEAERRSADIDAGTAVSVPAEEALARSGPQVTGRPLRLHEDADVELNDAADY